MTNVGASLTVLRIVVLAIMLFGLLGLIFPGLPGLGIIWIPALLYGLVTGFNWTSGILFGVITALMLLGNIVDNLVMGAKAKAQGASWLAIGVALAAGIVGSLAFPPFGGLIAALIGLFAVEMLRLRDLKQALASTRSMAVGCGWAALIRFGIGVLMILLWGAWVLWA
jgi:uncharacterized protein YqgC (DUF456 family)